MHDLATPALQDQRAMLLLELRVQHGRRMPLGVFRKPLVVIVGALDGCDRNSNPGAVLGLRALGTTGTISRLRVFWPSRPETPICDASMIVFPGRITIGAMAFLPALTHSTTLT